MALIFWLSCGAVAYVYGGYPLLLALWARLRPRPVARSAGADWPGVSIVIAARNEAERLPARIDNLVALDYPSARRQIIVVSDGSTDDTVARLAAYRDVDVISVPAGGKALALNAGVERARFDLLVFTDARQTFAPDALSELTRPFADPGVGAVSGELLLDSESGRRTASIDRRIASAGAAGEAAAVLTGVAVDRRTNVDRRRVSDSTIADGVGLYWRYEKLLRRLESSVASMLGATGAIYAMRRTLWTPLPADTILDDVLAPMRCVLAGHRVVFSPSARAYDRTSVDGRTEARRKVRTLAGNYQILHIEPRLLLPWRNPVWVQYVSHKVGRLLVPYALVSCFFSNIPLAADSRVYATTLAAQCLFYGLAGYGAWLDQRDRIGIRPGTGYVMGWRGGRAPDSAPRGAINV
jgi:biofilm PGA synthesis N-glycosyltransferase PgaC